MHADPSSADDTRARVRRGALAVALAGLAWASLCLALGLGGHAPSVTLVPIPRDRYYLAQAAFAAPTLFLLWGVCAAVTTRVARALGGDARLVETAGPLGVALAAPLLFLFVLPDAVAYAARGFEALGALVRVTAPLSFIATLGLATHAVRATTGLGAGRALAAALAGVVAQALVGGPLLR